MPSTTPFAHSGTQSQHDARTRFRRAHALLEGGSSHEGLLAARHFVTVVGGRSSIACQLASPPSRRWRAVLAAKRADESGIGLIAHIFRDSRQRRVAPAQQIGGEQHAPLRQVLHWGTAYQV